MTIEELKSFPVGSGGQFIALSVQQAEWLASQHYFDSPQVFSTGLRDWERVVSLGGDDHSSVPPTAPSAGTDRFSTCLGITGAESSAWGNWRRALRLDYMARSRRQGCASPVTLTPPPLTALAFAMRRRLRVTLALYTPAAKQSGSFLRCLGRLIWRTNFGHHDFNNHRLSLSGQRSAVARCRGDERQFHPLHDRFEAAQRMAANHHFVRGENQAQALILALADQLRVVEVIER
jgi:hypothetical protein